MLYTRNCAICATRLWQNKKDPIFWRSHSKLRLNNILMAYHQVGHRSYKNLKTIRPNMALLGQLFLNKSNEWLEFQKAVLNGHKNRQGQIRFRKEKQSIYTYPVPDCMCQA